MKLTPVQKREIYDVFFFHKLGSLLEWYSISECDQTKLRSVASCFVSHVCAL